MKNVFLFVFLLLSFTCFSQNVKTDSVNYRAYVVSQYFGGTIVGDVCDDLFTFRGNLITTTIDDQKRSFLIKEWKEDVLETGHSVKISECIDNGGFKLVMTIGYDKLSGSHFIVLSYNNIKFFYEVLEEPIPKSEDELYFYGLKQ